LSALIATTAWRVPSGREPAFVSQPSVSPPCPHDGPQWWGVSMSPSPHCCPAAGTEQRAVEVSDVLRGGDVCAGGPREGLSDVADLERTPSAVVARVAACVAAGDARSGVEARGTEVQGREDPAAQLGGQRVSGRRLALVTSPPPRQMVRRSPHQRPRFSHRRSALPQRLYAVRTSRCWRQAKGAAADEHGLATGVSSRIKRDVGASCETAASLLDALSVQRPFASTRPTAGSRHHRRSCHGARSGRSSVWPHEARAHLDVRPPSTS
jgi:hypothetical protein